MHRWAVVHLVTDVGVAHSRFEVVGVLCFGKLKICECQTVAISLYVGSAVLGVAMVT